MMKAGSRTVTTCRKEDGSLTVHDGSFTSVRKKHKILDIPVLRGVVNFVEMMMLSFNTLSVSADALGIEDEKEKAKKAKAKAEGKKAVGTSDFIMVIAMVLGLVLAVGLFFVLPRYAVEGIEILFRWAFHTDINIYLKEVIAGFIKVLIFVVYLCLVSLMKDIKHTFMYHGAEHKSIACFEAGDELTPANAMKHKRFHPRCGTSFMFLMILIGIIFGVAVKAVLQAVLPDGVELPAIAYSGIQILILPLTMGVGYEILMLAGKHDNWFTRAISAPGLWVQRITTKEPTEDMLEVAIISLKCALRDEYPEFREFYESRAWEAKESDECGDVEPEEKDPADGIAPDAQCGEESEQ